MLVQVAKYFFVGLPCHVGYPHKAVNVVVQNGAGAHVVHLHSLLTQQVVQILPLSLAENVRFGVYQQRRRKVFGNEGVDGQPVEVGTVHHLVDGKPGKLPAYAVYQRRFFVERLVHVVYAAVEHRRRKPRFESAFKQPLKVLAVLQHAQKGGITPDKNEVKGNAVYSTTLL